MYITCPACRASLEPDEIDRTRRECPLCSASLADVDLSAVENELSNDSEVIAGNPRPATSHSGGTTPPNSASQLVEIIEQTDDRLVAHIPPTTIGSGGIGVFALIWNGFLTIFTSIMVMDPPKKADRIEIFPYVFISVFWLVGIGFIVLWIRMRFTRLYLLLEKDRLVIQKKLFSTKNRELQLTPASKATLEESYTVNDVPVHCITIHGLGRNESFGAGLPPADQEFLSQRINIFLGVKETTFIASKNDQVCAHCGMNLGRTATAENDSSQLVCETCQLLANQNQSGTLWPPLRAGGREELPTNLKVDDSNPDQVLIHYPLLPSTGAVTFMKCVTTVVCLGFTGGALNSVGIFNQNGNWIAFALSMILGIPPVLLTITALLLLFSGQVQIAITREAILMRWGWGPFCIKKLILPETITACQIVRSLPSQINKGDTRRAAASPVGFAAIKVGDAAYPLVTFHGIEYGQKVIRLVRTYLKQVTGRELPG